MQKKLFQTLLLVTTVFGPCVSSGNAQSSTTPPCYCASVAYGGMDTIQDKGSVYKNAGGTCVTCQERCSGDYKIGFAYDTCWGESDKTSNCDACPPPSTSTAQK